MKKSCLPCLIFASTVLPLILSSCARKSGEDADVTKADRVKIGQTAPVFEVVTLDGQRFALKEQQGKVVVLDFFATWCGPCMEEMPHLEKELWQRYKDKRFTMIALGREHTDEELRVFKQKNNFTLPMAADSNRLVFSQYAEAYIPRLLLIDGEGRIVDQVVGFNEEQFKELVAKLDLELAKLKGSIGDRL